MDPLEAMDDGAGAPLPQSFSVELGLRRGTTLVARASVALRSGIPSTIVSGAEDELLWDWDVEVAQSAGFIWLFCCHLVERFLG